MHRSVPRWVWTLALVGMLGQPALAKSKKHDAPAPTLTRPVEFSRSVAPVVGVGVPVSGGAWGTKVGVKADVFDLSMVFPHLEGLSVIAPLTFTLTYPTSAIELTPGVEYRRFIGSSQVEVFGDLMAGYAYVHRVDTVAFVGYQTSSRHFFTGQVALGVSYPLTRKIDLYLEPAHFGLYLGTTTSVEYAPRIGLAIDI